MLRERSGDLALRRIAHHQRRDARWRAARRRPVTSHGDVEHDTTVAERQRAGLLPDVDAIRMICTKCPVPPMQGAPTSAPMMKPCLPTPSSSLDRNPVRFVVGHRLPATRTTERLPTLLPAAQRLLKLRDATCSLLMPGSPCGTSARCRGSTTTVVTLQVSSAGAAAKLASDAAEDPRRVGWTGVGRLTQFECAFNRRTDLQRLSTTWSAAVDGFHPVVERSRCVRRSEPKASRHRRC